MLEVKHLLRWQPCTPHVERRLTDVRMMKRGIRFFCSVHSCKQIYKNIHPWKSRSEFIQHVYDNVVYNKDGVIAINKPYGISIYKTDMEEQVKKQNFVQASNLPFNGDSEYTIEDSLPKLQELLEVPKLHIIKSTERYSSGIVLMSSNEKVVEKVQKAMRRGRSQNVPHLVYWAITKGCPTDSILKERVALDIDKSDSKEKQITILMEFSKLKVMRKDVKPVVVECHLIDFNKELSTSLVQVAVTSAKLHFLKVYMTTKLSYILGDVRFCGRIKEVSGKPIAIKPTNTTAHENKLLPGALCKRLDLPLTTTDNSAIPIMLHLHSIILSGYEKGKDVVITASPPSHFMWTCEKLDLLPENQQCPVFAV